MTAANANTRLISRGLRTRWTRQKLLAPTFAAAVMASVNYCQAEQVDPPAEPVARAAFEVLEKHCARCHQDGKLVGRLKAAKNFGNILRLDELVGNPQYILPGNPHGSRLFKQIVDNLLTNAIDALEQEEHENSHLTIRTYSSNGKVCVDVEDNGPGIPKEVQTRMFDPFFTTKSAEKGTGLGLAISLSILHKHDAQIEVESEEGSGTRFTISFPISSGE